MTNGQIAQAVAEHEPLYACIWSAPQFTPRVEVNTIEFFTDANGYRDFLRLYVEAIKLGYQGTLFPGHTVIRIN